jgi:hypothetical protein
LPDNLRNNFSADSFSNILRSIFSRDSVPI